MTRNDAHRVAERTIHVQIDRQGVLPTVAVVTFTGRHRMVFGLADAIVGIDTPAHHLNVHILW